ncbi:hypothetical protein OG21DRAFT_1520655 [Imleria badia]|nr:hypothetical protein OG21DRAFT_1520655 [Imleria badia]
MSTTKQPAADESEKHASMSREEMLVFYKIPREAVDVEAFAQERACYLRYTTEDAAFFSNFCQDPRLNTELLQFIKLGESADDSLDSINVQLAALTPPKTLEDRIVRARITEVARLVFDSLRLRGGLSDYPDLTAQVESRTTEIHDAWVQSALRHLFPETQSELPGVNLASSIRVEAFSLQEADIEDLLKTPSGLLEKQFYYRPGTNGGTVWEVEKYTISRGGDIVYKVRLKGCGDNLIRIDRDRLRLMLQESAAMV